MDEIDEMREDLGLSDDIVSAVKECVKNNKYKITKPNIRELKN